MEKQFSSITYEEIFMQPESFRAINQHLPAILPVLDQVFTTTYDQVIFTGCGTSFYLAQSAASMYSAKNQAKAVALPCSELYYHPESYINTNLKTLVVPITRKSYTTEVRMAIDTVRQLPGVKTLSVTCDANSLTYNDYMILSPEADEKSVIMTRSFSSMLYLCAILADYASGRFNSEKFSEYPDKAEAALKKTEILAKTIIDENPGLNLFIMLGQGVYYGVANECMNKIKEMGIANSEGYYTLEYRHGPMSLADENTLIVTLTNPATISFDTDLQTQMQSFGAITVSVGNLQGSDAGCRYHLDLGNEDDDAYLAPLASFVGQLLGYFIAGQKHIDADQPRNLSQAIVLKK